MSQEDGSGTLTYFAFYSGENDQSLGRCIWDVAQTAPLFLNTIPYQIRLGISCEYVDHVVNGVVVPAYYATVKYGLPSGKNKDKTPYKPGNPEEWTPPDPETPLPVPRLLSVRLTGGSQNITTHVAKSTRIFWLTPDPDYYYDDIAGGLINVDSDGTPEGVQVDFPHLAWSETWAFPIQKATPQLLALWNEYQYHYNTVDFRGYAPHTVLLTTWDANSEISYLPDGNGGFFIPGDSETAITFNFVLEPNVKSTVKDDPEWVIKGHTFVSPVIEKRMVDGKIVPAEIGKRVQEIYDGADLNKIFEVE